MVDLVITPANVIQAAGAQVSSGIAGETLTAGKALYLKAADGRYWLAQCDTTDAEATVVGIALHAATAGQPIVFQSGGPMNIGATTVKTDIYVLSAAAGGIAPQADLVSTNRIVYIGYATSTTGDFVVQIKVTGAVI